MMSKTSLSYLIQGTPDWVPPPPVDTVHWLASPGETYSYHWAENASLTPTFSVDRVNSPESSESPQSVRDMPLLIFFLFHHIQTYIPKHLEVSSFIHRLTAADKANRLLARAAHEG